MLNTTKRLMLILLAVGLLAPGCSKSNPSKAGAAKQKAGTAKHKLDERSRIQIAECNAGKSWSCSGLAERYQAGLVGDDLPGAARIREAAKYYRKSCAIRKTTTCPRAERLEAKLSQAKGSPK